MIVSLIQLDSLPTASLNFIYTVAIEFVCPMLQELLFVAYVSQVPSVAQPAVFVIYISVASVAAKVRFRVFEEVCVPPSMEIEVLVGAILS